LFSSLPNTDGFYTVHISQGNVATQLRCGDMFVNHFTANFFTEFTSEKSLKIGQYLAKIWAKLCGSLFWATLYIKIAGRLSSRPIESQSSAIKNDAREVVETFLMVTCFSIYDTVKLHPTVYRRYIGEVVITIELACVRRIRANNVGFCGYSCLSRPAAYKGWIRQPPAVSSTYITSVLYAVCTVGLRTADRR